MDLPYLNRCCFCCQLKTGATIVGVMTLISSVLMAIFLFTGTQKAWLKEGLLDDGFSLTTANATMLSVVIVEGILNIAFAIISILLLHGIRKDKPGLMKPYWIMGMIAVVVFLVNFVAFLILKTDSRAPQTYIGSLIANVVIQLYCNWIVYSYALTVRRENLRSRPIEM